MKFKAITVFEEQEEICKTNRKKANNIQFRMYKFLIKAMWILEC